MGLLPTSNPNFNTGQKQFFALKLKQEPRLLVQRKSNNGNRTNLGRNFKNRQDQINHGESNHFTLAERALLLLIIQLAGRKIYHARTAKKITAPKFVTIGNNVAKMGNNFKSTAEGSSCFVATDSETEFWLGTFHQQLNLANSPKTRKSSVET